MFPFSVSVLGGNLEQSKELVAVWAPVCCIPGTGVRRARRGDRKVSPGHRTGQNPAPLWRDPFRCAAMREGEKPSEKRENKNESRSRALSQPLLDGARGGFPTFSAPLPGNRHRRQLSHPRNSGGRRRRGARHENTPAKAENFLCVCD